MIDALIQYGPLLQKAIWETLLMVGITMAVAIIIGGPLGLVLFLTGRGGLSERLKRGNTLLLRPHRRLASHEVALVHDGAEHVDAEAVLTCRGCWRVAS